MASSATERKLSTKVAPSSPSSEAASHSDTPSPIVDLSYLSTTEDEDERPTEALTSTHIQLLAEVAANAAVSIVPPVPAESSRSPGGANTPLLTPQEQQPPPQPQRPQLGPRPPDTRQTYETNKAALNQLVNTQGQLWCQQFYIDMKAISEYVDWGKSNNRMAKRAKKEETSGHE